MPPTRRSIPVWINTRKSESRGAQTRATFSEYIGPALSGIVNLATQDYADTTKWKLLDRASGAQAFLRESSLTASGALAATAAAQQSISAFVFSGSVAVSGGGVGISLSGAGASAINKVDAVVGAYIDGDGAAGISAASIALRAADSSTISATVGAASLAFSFAPVSIAVSIGVGLARNEISDDVQAYIATTDTKLETTGGGISIIATSSGLPLFVLSSLTAADLNTATPATLSALATQFSSAGHALGAGWTLTALDAGLAWRIRDGDGSYVIMVGPDGTLQVAGAKIDAVAVAASLAIALDTSGAGFALGISGAGPRLPTSS